MRFESEMGVELEPGPECWLIKRPIGQRKVNNPYDLIDAARQEYRIGFEAGFAEAHGFEPNDVLTHEAP